MVQEQEDDLAKSAAETKNLWRSNVILQKRCNRFGDRKRRAEEQARSCILKEGHMYRLRYKGRYTTQARAIARRLIASGTAESKVGPTIQDIGKMMGIEIKEVMSEQTAKRAVLEKGVAATIQLGYEMTKTDSRWSNVYGAHYFDLVLPRNHV